MKVDIKKILLGSPKIRKKRSQILLENPPKGGKQRRHICGNPRNSEQPVIVRNHKRRRKHVTDLRFEKRRVFDCCFPRNWVTLRNKKQFKLLDEYLTRKVVTFDHF